MPTYKGTGEYKLLREDLSHTWGQGKYVSREYYGPASAISGLITELADTGWEFTITPEGPYSRLTATRQGWPDDAEQDYYDRFTVAKETIEKDIWTLDEIHEEVAAKGHLIEGDSTKYFDTYKDYIERAISEGDVMVLEGFMLPNSTDPDTGLWPTLWATYRELSRGVESYEEEYTVLTRERVVAVVYAGAKLPLPDFNTVTIYSTAALKRVFGIPDLTGIAWPTAPANNDTTLQWGWRNRRREVQQAEGQKINLIEDWAWAAWSLNLYPTYVAS